MQRESYIAGDWTEAAKFGDQRPFYPIPNLEETVYAFQQDYTQTRASRVNLAINTPSPDDANALLQLESAGNDIGNLMTRWTRSYFRVPAPWDDASSYSYSFIGFSGYIADPTTGIVQGSIAGRLRVPSRVTARLHWDYYVIDPDGLAEGVLDSAGNAINRVDSVDDIPVVPAQVYYIAGNPTSYFDYLSDGLPDWPFATVPTRSDYEAMITDGTEIVAEASSLQRFAGNIWGRLTIYVKAQ